MDEAFAIMMGRSEYYWQKRNFFLEALQAAEFHWFFVEGLIALEEELHLPGLLSIINGIEASMRWTHRHMTREANESHEPEKRSLMNNRLLNECAELGMPVEVLAFNGEADFLDKIKGKTLNAELVRVRNNICHGNIFEYVADREHSSIMLPGNLTVVSEQILWISYQWAYALGEFRRKIGIPHHVDTPQIPISNPYR
ncbi:hypothetical protein HBA92_03130 [Ochrobactrum sp. MR28]|nr:hypothetical protein [Ochrobactrum sp. MR28]MBX8815511.1 hypothetical protein [Ochrobactrum sp. MR31]